MALCNFDYNFYHFRKKKAQERQQQLLAEFASKQKKFIESLGEFFIDSSSNYMVKEIGQIRVNFGTRVYPKGSLVIAHVRVSVRVSVRL